MLDEKLSYVLLVEVSLIALFGTLLLMSLLFNRTHDDWSLMLLN